MLSLLVLKTNKLDQCLAFYASLGLDFKQEKHHDGPVHFSTTLGTLVLELYPTKNIPDSSTRLGFTVPNHLFSQLVKNSNVIQDPDGRKIELYPIKPPTEN